MDQLKEFISTFLGVVILAASLLPALHAFDHERNPNIDYRLTETITKASVDCDLCHFRITNAEAPEIYSYSLFIPNKETVYAISLAETVNLYPDPLFSLRAPPAVIS